MNEEFENRVLKVFLFTDLVGSTELKRRLGDVAGAQLISEHNQIFRRCLESYSGTEEDNAGDGFFATFDVPSDAVNCALAFQSALSGVQDHGLQARAGIHLGQSVVMPGAQDNPRAIGLAVDTAARFMGLAEGAQILMSRVVFDSVRQFVLSAPDGSAVRWLAHGPYLVKGVDEPIDVFEVGIPGLSPLHPPHDSEKATRAITPGDADRLGWRPAVGQPIPLRSDWKLERKLGEGAFGETWLAVHRRTGDSRVFKFCFEADSLRTLQREITLLRVLKNSLGERPDIARLLDWQLETPPYYLESEYAPGGDLPAWIESRDGLANVPLSTRLELVAQTADAVASAHQVGVLHNDIKPSNILIANNADGSPTVRIADFGVGAIVNRDLIDASTTALRVGTEMLATSSGRTGGTQLYMAPERLHGGLPGPHSDLFSLGVVLYQVVVGDLNKPLGFGWERDIEDDLVREDIADCVAIDPADRLGSAHALADRLRRLDERRSERVARVRRRRIRVGSAALAAVLLVGFGLFTVSNWIGGLAIGELRSLVENQVVQTNELAAQVAASLIGDELSEAVTLVEQTAQEGALQRVLAEGDHEGLQVLLDSYVSENSGIYSAALADPDGVILRRSPRDLSIEGNNFAFRDWFHGGSPARGPISNTHVSEPFVGRAQGKREMIGVSTPVRSLEGGLPAGVLLFTLTLNTIAELVQSASNSTGAQGLKVVVANEHGQLLVHEANPLFTEQAPAVWEPTIGHQGGNQLSDPLLGGTFLYGEAPIQPLGWIVRVLQDQRTTVSRIESLGNDVTRLQLGVVILVMVLIVLLGAMTMLIRRR